MKDSERYFLVASANTADTLSSLVGVGTTTASETPIPGRCVFDAHCPTCDDVPGTPSHEQLRRLAAVHVPPQRWFESEEDLF